MGRLTDKQRAEVITDYASGRTKSDIARKFNVSPNAISKILNNFKSSRSEEEVQTSSKTDNKEVARTIYNKAMESLKEKVDKASASELLKIIEYYDIKYNFAEEGSDEKVTAISIVVEDGTINDEATN
jgi:transposase-like protein